MRTSIELIEVVAKATGLTKKTVASAVNQMFKEMSLALSEGDSIKIRNFGILEVRETKPRSYFGGKVTVQQGRRIVRLKESRKAPWRSTVSNTTQSS